MEEYKIAETDIVVYHFVSYGKKCVYIPLADTSFEPNVIEEDLREPFHVYPNHNVLFMRGYGEVCGDNYCGEYLQAYYMDYIGKFIIPKGSKYYEDKEEGEIITTQLMWTGTWANRLKHAKKVGCIEFEKMDYEVRRLKK